MKERETTYFGDSYTTRSPGVDGFENAVGDGMGKGEGETLDPLTVWGGVFDGIYINS
jgi:hypothetical protein